VLTSNTVANNNRESVLLYWPVIEYKENYAEFKNRGSEHPEAW
jgi:hypothetical protein